MKKIIFLFSFVLLSGLTLSAQCTKTASSGEKACCASKKGGKVASASVLSEAEQVAAQNENIQKRVCETSGKVTYYEKSVCDHSGSVSWNEVEYNKEAKKFTRVASASMERDAKTGEAKTVAPAACCKKEAGKACCKKGEKACAGEKKEGSK